MSIQNPAEGDGSAADDKRGFDESLIPENVPGEKFSPNVNLPNSQF